MLAFHIILAIIAVIAVVIFAVKAENIKNAIEDIYAKQAILHDKYCNHEDRIDGNYKNIAELNRRQDEWQRQHNESDKVVRNDISRLGTDVDRLKAEFIVFAQNKAKDLLYQPATDPRETRDAKQTAQANRGRFAELRKTMGVKQAREEMGIGKSTATRYEKWRRAQEQ